MRPEYSIYEDKVFETNLAKMREAIAKAIERALQDDESVERQLQRFPIKQVVERGVGIHHVSYPLWQEHVAQKLLQRDIALGFRQFMTPEELWKAPSRALYKLWPLEVFRGHYHQELLAIKQHRVLALHFDFSFAPPQSQHDFDSVLGVFIRLREYIRSIQFFATGEPGTTVPPLNEEQIKQLLQTNLRNLVILRMPGNLAPILREIPEEARESLEELSCLRVIKVEQLKIILDEITCCRYPNLEDLHLDCWIAGGKCFDFFNVLRDMKSNTLQSVSLYIQVQRIDNTSLLTCLGMFFAHRNKSLAIHLSISDIQFLDPVQTRVFIEFMKRSPPSGLHWMCGSGRLSQGDRSVDVFIEMSQCMKGPGSCLAFHDPVTILDSQECQRFLQAIRRTKVRKLDFIFADLTNPTTAHLATLLQAFSRNTTITSSSFTWLSDELVAMYQPRFQAICHGNLPNVKVSKLIRQDDDDHKSGSVAAVWPAALMTLLRQNDAEYMTAAYTAVHHLVRSCSAEAPGNRKRNSNHGLGRRHKTTGV